MKRILLFMMKLNLLLVIFVFACSKTNDTTKIVNKSQNLSLLNAINDNELVGNELADAINTNDIQDGEVTLQEMSNDIANFYLTNHNIDLQQEFDNDDTRIILFGLIEEANEKYVSSPSSADLGCFFTAVSTFIGVTQARGIWKSIVSGSYNAGTVIDALTLMGKRVAGVITVAIMVYDVGECLGWWEEVPIDRSESEAPTDINAIPIEFFIGSEVFDELHHPNILSYLNTNYGMNSTEAYQVIATVINSNGDPTYEGTTMIKNYFQSINQDA